MNLTKVIRSARISYTEYFNLDDWRELVRYLILKNSGKPFKFNDSQKIKKTNLRAI